MTMLVNVEQPEPRMVANVSAKAEGHARKTKLQRYKSSCLRILETAFKVKRSRDVRVSNI